MASSKIGNTPTANTARQNGFNDQDFIPRGADNVVTLRVASDPFSGEEATKKT